MSADQPVGTVQVNLTQHQLRSALSALYAAKVENNIYLAQTPAQRHDPCCTAEAAREQRRQEMHEALVQTREHIVGAITELERHEIPRPENG